MVNFYKFWPETEFEIVDLSFREYGLVSWISWAELSRRCTKKTPCNQGQGNAQVEAGTEISQGLSRSSRTDSRDTIAILAEQRRKEVGPLPNVQVTLHGVDMNRYVTLNQFTPHM